MQRIAYRSFSFVILGITLVIADALFGVLILLLLSLFDDLRETLSTWQAHQRRAERARLKEQRQISDRAVRELVFD